MLWLVADIHLSDIACLHCEKLQRDPCSCILRMSFNIATTMFSFASWVIYVPIGCRILFINYWQPLLAKSTATYSLPHAENERQRSINSFSCCIFGNHGIALIFAFITELFTAMIAKNSMYQRQNLDFKLIDNASCKAFKNISQWLKTRFWYDSIQILQKQEPQMNLWMDPLGDPLTTRPIQMSWEFTIEPYPSWQCGFIDNPDRQSANGVCWTRTRTQIHRPEPFLTLGWWDVADNIRERDKMYGTTEWKVPAVVQTQMADVAASSAPTTFVAPMETLDSVPKILQMPRVTSRPGSSHMRLGSRRPQTHNRIPSLLPAPMPYSSLNLKSKHV